MGELVRDQFAVAPTVGAHKDPVLQSQAAGRRDDKVNRTHRCLEFRMVWNRNRIHPKQTNPLGVPDADRFGIGDPVFRKRHAFAKNTLLLFDRPLGSERKQFA